MLCCEWPVLYVSLYGDEWKNRSSGIYYLKSLKTLDNSNLQIYPHGILFCQERPGIMEETHK